METSDWIQTKQELEAYFAKFSRVGKMNVFIEFFEIPIIHLNFSGEIDIKGLMNRIHFINGNQFTVNFLCLEAEKRTRTIMINTHDKAVQADTPHISDYFSRYGRVLSNIPLGKNKSQSFLKFEEYESAEKALGEKSSATNLCQNALIKVFFSAAEGPHIIGLLAISVFRAKNY